MPRLLPPRPDLEQLKTQARELQRAYNLGELIAQQRFAQYLPSAVSRQPLVDGRRLAPLAQALTVLAREYGFTSWPLLRQHVIRVSRLIVAGADLNYVPEQEPPKTPVGAHRAGAALAHAHVHTGRADHG